MSGNILSGELGSETVRSFVKPPKGVYQIHMASGEICARVSADVVSKGLALAVGERQVPFTELPDADLERMPAYLAFPLRVDPLFQEPEAKELCEARINAPALADWALENGETLQIRVFNENRPMRVHLGGKLIVPASGKPRRFHAALAAHRADAELEVRIATRDDGRSRTETVRFDPAKQGGRFRSGYQEVAVDLPAKSGEIELTLGLVYKGFRDTGEDHPPFLFLANPEVRDRERRSADAPGITLNVEASPAEASWYRAFLPAPLGPDNTLDLVVGATPVTVFSPERLQIELVEDHGHTLVMTASRAGRYGLFFDGKKGLELHLGPERTAARIPPEQLTGETHHFAVRDPAGMQTFFETFLAPPRIMTPEDVMLRESTAPFPGTLTPRERHRYELLKTQLASPHGAAEQAQLTWAMEILEGGYDNVRLKPLAFPEVTEPEASVVIPAHNKVEVTYYALCALLLARNETRFEVIVVDDASTDETAELEEIVSGITVVRNAKPQRFVRACNTGVARSTGKYVVLLNNDTEPTVGWLDELIDAFQRFPNVGLAGSKLLYADGRLQDAGGIVWASGNPWNYGNRANQWDPRFSYARQADYLSGAAMMTTRAIWDEVGGLSEYLEPMYFEDTDFAFKVREAGYTTWYVPSSVVYHFEGMTSGTDVSTGFKRYQEVNRPKFKRRWAKAFSGFRPEGTAPDLEKDRGIVGRVLFVDYTTPRPDRDAGGYAAIQEMKLVQSLGYKVTFLPENMAHLGRYTADLQKAGIEVATAPFFVSREDFFETRGAEFDAVYITRYHVARTIVPQVRKVAPSAKIILNNADLHFLRQLRTALAHNDPLQLEAARKVRDEELEVMRRADVVLSYNDVEHAVIQSHTDGAVKVLTAPWVVDVPGNVPPLEARDGLTFLGSFRHHPNTEGVKWFASEVMPLINSSHPHVVLSIYGAGMTDEIRELASETIEPVGYVKDTADAYDRHRIFVAPLLSGAGIKGKVLSALAHGVPTVLTPVAAEGTGLRHGHDCMIASTAAEWTRAITQLYDDPDLWAMLSQNGRAYVSQRFSFEAGRTHMRAAFEAVDLFGAVA